ncbi:MAG TPA: FAD-dependent oxidoreductase [Opitutaceae bacterium]|nr:FAD-dependent oxidoreductase [Opitutaceae bacterium]
MRDGLPTAFPALSADLQCDVAVIGAGISGALAAWHLAEAGLRVVILDRREVAHGSTAASTCLIQYELDEPLHRLERRYGWDAASYAYRRCRRAVHDLDRLIRKLRIACEYENKASLLLAHGPSHCFSLRREFEARRKACLDVEWWDRPRIRRSSDLPHPAGILSHDGAQLDDYHLAYGLLQAAMCRGAQVFDRTEITRTQANPKSVELRTRAGARVRASHVVVATGYEADSAMATPLTELHSTFAIISEPVAHFPGWPAGRCLIWETSDPYTYLRTTREGRIILGGYDVPFRDPRERGRLLPRKAAVLQRRFRQFFPSIPFQLAWSWAGTFARTADGLPFIGAHPNRPRTWLALGYGGNGITFSLIAAELIRDQILGRPNPDGGIFGFGRPSPGAWRTAVARRNPGRPRLSLP